jgi:sterol desaturase/sphingolipid hydroxylase (fatty acid hydroxylase superfamily)
MSQWILSHQSMARAGIFFGALALMLLLERSFPRRHADPQRRMRWPANFGLVVVDTAVLFALPVAAVGAAVLAQSRGWGLLNILHAPLWLSLPLGWLLLDCAIYWQHRTLHEVRWLWPLHRVHHSDIELDATTGLRFHPAEILLSMLYKCTVVVVLGAPLAAVLLFEIALNGLALFNHANLRLPGPLDRSLRKFLVTPDMHRIHHSVYRVEMDSNYGNALSLWDYLFHSYTPVPRDGDETMRIGLEEFRGVQHQRLWSLLAQPTRRQQN